jgi:hypothetical protein
MTMELARNEHGVGPLNFAANSLNLTPLSKARLLSWVWFSWKSSPQEISLQSEIVFFGM